jgi:hypothetical protein
MQPLAWPINTSIFVNLLVQEWAKALINPRSVLGVPTEKILEFQLAALILMDHIWLSMAVFDLILILVSKSSMFLSGNT